MSMKKLFTFLVLMLALYATGYSQLGDLLYNQSTSPVADDPYTSTNDGTTNIQSSDDFWVNYEETMEVGQFTASFVSGTHTNFYVTLSTSVYDAASYLYVPGETVYSGTLTGTPGEDLGGYYTYIFNLPEVYTLEGGQYYWLTIVAADGSGQWVCSNTLSGNYAVTKDYNGTAGWTYYWTSGETYYNLDFTVRGPQPEDNDLMIVDITAPTIGELSATEEISIQVKNRGMLSQDDYSLSYLVRKLVEDEWVEYYTSQSVDLSTVLASGDVLDYTFSETVDLSEITTYAISAVVNLPSDDITSNDTLTIEVENIGPNVFMGQEEEMVSCGLKFYDDGGPNDLVTWTSADTITFYPSNAGDRVTMDFVSVDLGYDIQALYFYDGESTDANLLYTYTAWDDLPGETIVARNASGAITVVATAGSYYYGWYNGWEIYVSCVTPDDVSFGFIADASYDDDFIFTNDNASDISCYLANSGTSAMSRKVYLLENDIAIDSLTTDELPVGGIDTLTFNWAPSVLGDAVSVKLKIQDDPQETNEDNLLELYFDVYDKDILIESFEDGELPWNWVSTEGTSVAYNDAYSSPNGAYYLRTYGASDTIIMPLVAPEAGDKLKFVIATGNYGSSLNLIYAKNLNGPWSVLDEVEGISYTYSTLEYALDAFTDTAYYFAFAYSCDITYDYLYLDFIRSAKPYAFENDIALAKLSGNLSTQANKETLFDVSLRNAGTEAIAGKDYMVYLKDEAGTTLATALGADLSTGESTDIKVAYTFTEVDTAYFYAEVVLSGELRTDNNTSAMSSIKVNSDSTYVYELPYDSYVSYNYYDFPVPASKMTGATEMIIYPEEIQQSGEMTSIEFQYVAGADYAKAPLTVYLAHVPDSLLGYSYEDYGYTYYTAEWLALSSVEYTVVFDDSLDFYAGENSLKIDFENSFDYNGTDNLFILIDKDSTDTYMSNLQFKQVIPEHMSQPRYVYTYDYYGYEIDLDAPTQYISCMYSGYMPFTRFYFNKTEVPEFESEPVTRVGENMAYSYEVEVTTIKGSALSVKAIQLPDWLSLTKTNDTLALLSGTTDVLGDYSVILEVTDGNIFSTQSFVLSVNAVPVFVSSPDTVVAPEELYQYNIELSSADGAIVAISGNTLPAGFIISDNGDNTATLMGTPTEEGELTVSILAEGTYYSAIQEYTLYVENEVSVNDLMAQAFELYPNPAHNEITLTNVAETRITLIDMNGKVISTIESHMNKLTIPLHALHNGVYFIQVVGKNYTATKKLIVE